MCAEVGLGRVDCGMGCNLARGLPSSLIRRALKLQYKMRG